jgi:hypothetical protein
MRLSSVVLPLPVPPMIALVCPGRGQGEDPVDAQRGGGQAGVRAGETPALRLAADERADHPHARDLLPQYLVDPVDLGFAWSGTAVPPAPAWRL